MKAGKAETFWNPEVTVMPRPAGETVLFECFVWKQGRKHLLI